MKKEKPVGYTKSLYNFIVKNFGEQSAKVANYGWVVTDKEYCTKIYKNPYKVVISRRNYLTNKIEYTIE